MIGIRPRSTLTALALALAATLVASLAAPGAAAAKVRAVFVGIDKYQFSRTAGQANAGFDDLSGAVADTRRIKAALTTAYGFALDQSPPGQCRSGNAASITLTDTCATKAAILAAWNDAIRASAAGDTLILYFAGHGSRFLDQNGQDQASLHNSTLMAHDARQPGAQADADIIDNEVRAIIDSATGKGVRVVTWFDSCNSGTASRDGQSASRSAPDLMVSNLRPMAPPRQYGSYGAYRVHLGAAGDGEDAKEVGSVGNRAGVFTTALAKALIAAPQASFADIAAKIVEEVTTATRNRQLPHAEGALRATLDGPEIRVPTFDVVLDRGQLVMAGGALVGVTAGSEFALYTGTSEAVNANGDAPLLVAQVTRLEAGLAFLMPIGGMPANLPGRMVAREQRHRFASRLGLAVNDAAALGVVQRLGFVAVDARGPFRLASAADGTMLFGRGGVELAKLPAADAPNFAPRLAAALEKVARAEEWLALMRPRAGIALCVATGDRANFDPLGCPSQSGGRTLRLKQPAWTSVVNESDQPRFAYVLGISSKYEVTLAMPGFGAVERTPLAAGTPLAMPRGQSFSMTSLEPMRFVAISSDAPMPAGVLEQSATDVQDKSACLSAVARAFCLGADGARSGGIPRVINWSVAVVPVEVAP
ncbi:caspase family protein [Sandarakinorhabdus sp.]|uniref:caspase family protein n=1 Tax=Sandarakinorhabdus sp. TaxID=1916663 RepID=UPI00333F57D2